MDDLTASLSGKFIADWPEWHLPTQTKQNPAGRSKLSNLFEKLEYYTRQGKRIRNEPLAVAPRQAVRQPCLTTARKYRKMKEQAEEAVWIFPTPPKQKMLILAPVEFDYSQSLQRTREKSKELLDINNFSRNLETNKRRRLRNLSQDSKRPSNSPSRPSSRGLDQLCVQTIKGILFPSPRQSSSLTKTKKKEFEETLMRRLRLLKSCYSNSLTE